MTVVKISKNITCKVVTYSNTTTLIWMRNEPDETQLKAMKKIAKEVFILY